MENNNGSWFAGDGLFAIIIFFIVAGMFNGGFGFGNNARADISNEFLYNQLANDVRANGQAIATTDRDVLTTSCNTDKEVLQNRYDNALQTQTLSRQMSECCCENRLAIANQTSQLTATMNANTQAILDKMCNTEIQNLRDQVRGYELVAALGNQTNTLSQRFGTWYPNPPFSPYYYGTYGNYGTTII